MSFSWGCGLWTLFRTFRPWGWTVIVRQLLSRTLLSTKDCGGGGVKCCPVLDSSQLTCRCWFMAVSTLPPPRSSIILYAVELRKNALTDIFIGVRMCLLFLLLWSRPWIGCGMILPIATLGLESAQYTTKRNMREKKRILIIEDGVDPSCIVPLQDYDLYPDQARACASTPIPVKTRLTSF